MTTFNLSELSQAQKERLYFIDFRLYFLAVLNRHDLIKRFGIKEAAATRDITAYRKLKPSNTHYDSNAKSYIKTKRFTPLFSYNAIQVLSALSGGIGDAFTGIHKPLVSCEAPARLLNHPDINILAVLSNAINLSQTISMEYHSLSSGKTTRELLPFALVDNGLRWHIRGYDRKRERFGDFVLTRITKAQIIERESSECELKDADNQWNRIVELELVPHPNLSNPTPIGLDYNMAEGVLKINVRAAVAGYALRRWNVDCSIDHSLIGDEYHLWLRNTLALYGVNNLAIAPGYKENKN